MNPQTVARLVAVSAALGLVACADERTPANSSAAPAPSTQAPPAAPPAAPPVSTLPAPAQPPPPTLPAPPSAPPPASPPVQTPPPPQMPPMPAPVTAGTGATPPTMPGAKQYTFDEVLALKRDDLIKAWSEAPAKEVWIGCAGKYAELKHATDGAPMQMPQPTWMGKCIPMDTKVLYNIVSGMASMPGDGMTANRPAEVKESFIDKKPAVVVVYPGGYELHFRNLGDKLWVGRQSVNGTPSGTWYPLGEISGDGMRK